MFTLFSAFLNLLLSLLPVYPVLYAISARTPTKGGESLCWIMGSCFTLCN